ncbi:mucosal addressin cell adhesion molecule 1 isoform X2 [Hemicordylus capensis]|uniref:mucosal addressin cell adhesion molecule 1 isoform X2 n=1 Tax=Hemicordylus capensis TaxID=884348 RepID=UPI002302901B|nr:mucosal addressin cell adhesion molecule 1 isoform X2 [Hemicordylus capensis]
MAYRKRPKGATGLPRKSMLTIHPQEPVVEHGGSIQLNCSMDCPGGKVEWQGLDTDLGNMISEGTYSILTVTNALPSMEGMKLCIGQCHSKIIQKKVELKVYSLPDTLHVESKPKVLVAGQRARLSCSLSDVYPSGSLTLSWFRGDERLQGSETKVDDVEGPDWWLFNYRSELEVPAAEPGAAYRCEAELELGPKMISLTSQAVVSAPAAPTAARTTETASTLVATRTSPGATPELPTTMVSESPNAATTSSFQPLRSTQNPTVVAPAVTNTAASSPSPTVVGDVVTISQESATTKLATTTATATLPPATEAAATLTATWPASLLTSQQPDTDPVPTEGFPSATEGDPCRPVITPVPRQGVTGGPLRITCHVAECGGDVRIRWVQTPVDQSQYRQEEAKGQSTLAVESVSLEHQGDYRCVTVGGQTRMASLRVAVSAATFSTDSIIAVGTAGSLLGLIITGYVSRRMRQNRS